MFDSLADFVNYSEFSVRVRQCEKQLKISCNNNQLSQTKILEEQDIFFRDAYNNILISHQSLNTFNTYHKQGPRKNLTT